MKLFKLKSQPKSASEGIQGTGYPVYRLSSVQGIHQLSAVKAQSPIDRERWLLAHIAEPRVLCQLRESMDSLAGPQINDSSLIPHGSKRARVDSYNYFNDDFSPRSTV